MTHPRLDTIFKAASGSRSVSCSDPYLRTTLLEYAYCKGNPDYVTELAHLDAELSTPEMLERLRKAINDDEEVLRTDAAKRLVSTRQPGAEALLLQFMESDRFYDRMILAPLASLFHSDEIDKKVVELAKSDPISYVRGAACTGLLGKDPRISIPVLLQVMEESGEDVDPEEQTPAPSEIAANILDEVLGTSYTELRLGNGFATFPPKGYKPKALVAKAKKVLKALNEKSP